MSDQKPITSVATGVIRLSYANVWEAKKMDDDSDAKYGTAVLIKKDDKFTLDKVNAAIDHLVAEVKKRLT